MTGRRGRWTIGVVAALGLATLGLSGCVMTPPPIVPPAPSAPAPVPSEPPAPTIAPTPTPTSTSAVVDGTCNPEVLDALVFGYDPQTLVPEFAFPELIAGYEASCTGTQPSNLLPDVEFFTIAFGPLSEDAFATIRQRVLDTGLVPDSLMPDAIFVDAVNDPIAFLQPLSTVAEINEIGPYLDGDDWLVLRWYDKP